MIHYNNLIPLQAEEDHLDLMKMAAQVQASYRYQHAHAGNVNERWEQFHSEHCLSQRKPILKRLLAAACMVGFIGLAIAALVPVFYDQQPDVTIENGQAEETNMYTITSTGNMVVFDNVTLQVIMENVAEIYHVKVSIPDESVASIRMHFQLEKSMKLDDVILLLNHFEQVRITRHNDVLLVE